MYEHVKLPLSVFLNVVLLWIFSLIFWCLNELLSAFLSDVLLCLIDKNIICHVVGIVPSSHHMLHFTPLVYDLVLLMMYLALLDMQIVQPCWIVLKGSNTKVLGKSIICGGILWVLQILLHSSSKRSLTGFFMRLARLHGKRQVCVVHIGNKAMSAWTEILRLFAGKHPILTYMMGILWFAVLLMKRRQRRIVL